MSIRSMIMALLSVLMIFSGPYPSFAAENVKAALSGASASQGTASLSSDTVHLKGTVTVTAAKTVGAVYAFYYRLPEKETWTKIRDYSQELTASVKAAYVGKYTVLVKTKDAAGKITKEYLSFEAVDDLALKGSVSRGTAPLGTGTVVSARTSGGNGGYTYQVLRRKKDSTAWKSILKDSPSCRVLFNPAAAGEYDICVKVTDKTGVTRKQYLSFEATDYSTSVALQSDPLLYGQRQTITASVTGGAVCSYSFYFKNPTDSSWRTIRNDTGRNTVTLKPAKVGRYQLCVKAVTSTGNVRKVYSGFDVYKKLTVSHTLSESILEKGSSLIVTPSSTGGFGSIRYAVYYSTKEDYEAGTGKWTTALKFGQTGNAVITPKKAGEYVVVTKAKDEKGTIKKTAPTNFTVTEKLSAGGSFKDQRSTVYYRTGTVFLAEAAGGTGPYTYALKIREKGASKWKLIRNFDTDPQITLQSAQIGSYTNGGKDNFELTVTVKDTAGKTAQYSCPFTVNYSDRYELPVIS